MQQADSTQEHVQGFRSVHKSEPHSTISVPLDSLNITHIDCYTDPDTQKDFVLWEHIQQVFDEALFVRNKTKMLPFVRGEDHRVLEPRRIAAVPDVVLDVVVSDKLNPITSTDTATADTIASLQVALQELLLNTRLQTVIESATRNSPCGTEPKATQNKRYIDKPKSTHLPRRIHASEGHSQDNNGNVINSQLSEATNNAKKRLNDPQEYDAAANVGLMQTVIDANHGDIQAQVALGDLYKAGREVHQDYQAAMNWYVKAAEQGHTRAQYNLGLLCRQGLVGIPQDHSKAFEWFLKAALQGYAEAQAEVSQAYTNGAGVPKDNIKAMEWSIKAAENGHAERQHYMGAAYEKGHGVPQSDSRSFEWYLKSADQGFAEAQERVAAALMAGRGTPEDGPQAVEWYTKVADQGVAVAQFSLGCVYNLGFCGLPNDRAKAVGWFIKAAVQGHAKAQFMLREIYDLSTSNSHPDFGLDLGSQLKIKEWFMDAANQGLTHAQCCMAFMYEDGRGVDKDDSKAFQWYLKAAEQGDETAKIRVALWYRIGRGVSKSRENSDEWYIRLATGGNGWALERLKATVRK
ncbi:hypothetical protein BGZ89_003060 [Linnemannia elongata]|nr:hypothetical protein BGZ89_003060 [Linnemannia elongata]